MQIIGMGPPPWAVRLVLALTLYFDRGWKRSMLFAFPRAAAFAGE